MFLTMHAGRMMSLVLAASYLMTAPLRPDDAVFHSQKAKAVLVELYSSEGCSSCPPAEAWASRLKDSPDLWRTLFPVVFHVDYWDKLGWPDRFARPDFTQRQRDYAKRLGQDSVYTPEFIVDGGEWRDWSTANSVPPARAISRGDLMLTVNVDARKVSATFSPGTAGGSVSYTLHIAVLGAHVMSDVMGGENGGRLLQHDFVVLDFLTKTLDADSAGSFQSGALDFNLPTENKPGAAVAWVVDKDGALVQIAGGWLKSSAR